jgi:hypothetical protein
MSKKFLMAVACLGAAIGSAQTMETVHVKLPVDTKVGNVSFAAGSYSIRGLTNNVLEISSDEHNGRNMFVSVNSVITPTGAVADHTKVVLKKSENGYEIQTIWLEGQDIGFEMTASE